MAANKPRGVDGPLEVTKEARSYIMRLPADGGGRIVIELSRDEALDLAQALDEALALS